MLSLINFVLLNSWIRKYIMMKEELIFYVRKSALYFVLKNTKTMGY